MTKRDIVVIGASAGGLGAIQELNRNLPRDLDAAVLVVLHTSRDAGNILVHLFRHEGNFPVVHPVDGTRIVKKQIYVAPPDFHLIIEDGYLRVIQGPLENRHRPAIDPLFRSAAANYGPRVIGVILSGLMDDGTAGLMAVHAAGGEAIVQDPETALFPSMPQNALRQVPQAHVAPLAEIPALLLRLSGREVRERKASPVKVVSPGKRETENMGLSKAAIKQESPGALPSQFACPECGGVLWEIDDAGFLRFRCRVGHAFTAAHLDAEQHHAVEAALWSALRALEERASLYRQMAERLSTIKLPTVRQQYEENAAEKEGQAKVLRDFLLKINTGAPALDLEKSA